MEQTQKTKKKKTYTKQITALAFFGVLAVLCLFNLIFGNKEAHKPALRITAVLDGSYMEDYETYFEERFAGKGAFTFLNESVETLFGKRDSSGIWKGKDEYLLEEIAEPDKKNLEKNLEAVNAFSEAYYNVPVYFMLVPNAASILPDKMPAYHIGEDQDKQFEEIEKKLGTGINWVDVRKTLKKHRDEDIYYRTDKNWTTLGAQYGYEVLAQAMGLDVSKAPKLEPYVVNNDFSGSLAQKSGYGKNYEDSISIYAPDSLKDNLEVLVTDADENMKSATLYDRSKLDGRDKYSLFLGGDHGMLDIRTTAESADRLLVFKDSYANCLIPFLVPYYREIVMIDPSLYKGNLEDVMEGRNFTGILFLYSGNSFVTDSSVGKVLEIRPDTPAVQTTAGSAAVSASQSGETDAGGADGGSGDTDAESRDGGLEETDAESQDSGTGDADAENKGSEPGDDNAGSGDGGSGDTYTDEGEDGQDEAE